MKAEVVEYHGSFCFPPTLLPHQLLGNRSWENKNIASRWLSGSKIEQRKWGVSKMGKYQARKRIRVAVRSSTRPLITCAVAVTLPPRSPPAPMSARDGSKDTHQATLCSKVAALQPSEGTATSLMITKHWFIWLQEAVDGSFVLFHSCRSHAVVLGTTLVHEFQIFYCDNECLFARGETVRAQTKLSRTNLNKTICTKIFF